MIGQQIFWTALGASTLILSVLSGIVVWQVVKALKKINQILGNTKETTDDISTIFRSVGSGLLGVINMPRKKTTNKKLKINPLVAGAVGAAAGAVAAASAAALADKNTRKKLGKTVGSIASSAANMAKSAQKKTATTAKRAAKKTKAGESTRSKSTTRTNGMHRRYAS